MIDNLTTVAGSLADALEELAKGSSFLSQEQRLESARRFLALFSEFGLANDLNKFSLDLVALLPAVAAACEAVRSGPDAAQLPDASDAVTAAHAGGDQAPPEHPRRTAYDQTQTRNAGTSTVLASLDGLRAHDAGTVKHFRNAWLYCGMLGLGASQPQWLQGWQRADKCWVAMGRLAASTPVLMYGTGIAKEREAEQRVLLELSPHLAAAGAEGKPAAITAKLHAMLLRPPKIPEKNASNAFLLAIATLEVSRVAIGPLPPPAAGASPLVHSMAYAGGAQPTTVDHAVYVSLMTTAFHALVQRLTSSKCQDAQPAAHLERLADVLIQAICTAPAGVQLRKKQAGHDAEPLLQQLLDAAPALYYSRACIHSWLAHGSADTHGDADTRLSTWLANAATRAPTHMEHVVQSLAMASGQDAAEQTSDALAPTQSTYMLDAVRLGRQRSLLGESTVSNFAAIHRKSAAMGRVEVWSEQGCSEEQVIDSLQELASSKLDDTEHRRRCCNAAATIVSQLQRGKLPLSMLVALAQLPLLRFTGHAVDNVVFAWHWVVAESAEARNALVAHMLPVWQSTLQRSLGLFSSTWVPPRAPLTSGDVRTWDAQERDASLLDGLRAHHAWIMCLTEVWESSRHATLAVDASPMLPALLAIFRCTLSSASAISTHPLARLPLFRLLSLVLRCAKHLANHPPAGRSSSDAEDLLQAALSLGLRSFAQPIAAHMAPSKPEVSMLYALDAFTKSSEVLQVCTSFCVRLQHTFCTDAPFLKTLHSRCVVHTLLSLRHDDCSRTCAGVCASAVQAMCTEAQAAASASATRVPASSDAGRTPELLAAPQGAKQRHHG